MSSFASAPVCAITCETMSGAYVCAEAASMQGWRAHMEDRMVMHVLNRHPGTAIAVVMDGHGGDWVATWLASRIVERFNSSTNPERDAAAVVESFDRECRAHPAAWSCGSTIAAAIIRRDRATFVTVGDSRIALVRERSVVAHTRDHRPTHPVERRRIVAAGFRVDADGRISGGLNMSRAVGDHVYKPHGAAALLCVPDIATHAIEVDDRIVLSSDGFSESESAWSAFLTDAVHDPSPRNIFTRALARGASDNMTYCRIRVLGSAQPELHSKSTTQDAPP